MSTKKFRAFFFLYLVGAKFLVIGWLFLMWLTYGYNFEQLKDIFYVLAPIFAAHLIPAFSFYSKLSKSKKEEADTSTSKVFVRVTWFLLIGYTIYMIAILSQVPGQEAAFANMKEMLAWGEILFGAFIGIIVSELYSS